MVLQRYKKNLRLPNISEEGIVLETKPRTIPKLSRPGQHLAALPSVEAPLMIEIRTPGYKSGIMPL